MTSTGSPHVVVNRIKLAALPTAAGCSRKFVAAALRRWRMHELTDPVQLVVSELVTNAVKATGVTGEWPRWVKLAHLEFIVLQLSVLADTLLIEVWDSDPHPPAPRHQRAEAENGRGLYLVEAVTKRWDMYRPQEGGKVVWAELELPRPAAPPAPPQSRRRPVPRPPRRPVPTAKASVPAVDTALLQRLLNGLRAAA